MAFLDNADRSDSDAATPPSVNLDAALSAVERLTLEYPKMARINIEEIRARLAKTDGIDPEEEMLELRRFAHNFAGQGASFNYPLISDIANLLRAYFHAKQEYAALDLSVVCAHVEAIAETLDRELNGDAGDEGKAILARLESLAG